MPARQPPDGRSGDHPSGAEPPRIDVEEDPGASLVEGVVLVAALGGLHARGQLVCYAAIVPRGPQPPRADLNPQPASRHRRVAVIDEHRELNGVRVERRRHPADVPRSQVANKGAVRC